MRERVVRMVAEVRVGHDTEWGRCARWLSCSVGRRRIAPTGVAGEGDTAGGPATPVDLDRQDIVAQRVSLGSELQHARPALTGSRV